MKILPVPRVKIGAELAQNIYRHDGLLLFPKGIRLRKMEIEAIHSQQIDFIAVSENRTRASRDLQLMLDVIASAYKQSALWDREFGEKVVLGLEKKIKKNKKVQKYLHQLRTLDSYSFVHCVNVSMVICSLLAENNEADSELIHLTYLALLHDIGRVKMKKIFNKEGKLSHAEFEELRKHPEYSFRLLKKAGFSESELRSVLEHHEKHNGTGYPQRLREHEIEDLAQLILVADLYNGLSSDRPYRKAYDVYEVCEMIKKEENQAFGERYVRFFFQKFTPYRIGTQVELTNDAEAVVKHYNEDKKLFPVVEMIPKPGSKPIVVNLAYQKDLKIKRIIQAY